MGVYPTGGPVGRAEDWTESLLTPRLTLVAPGYISLPWVPTTLICLAGEGPELARWP